VAVEDLRVGEDCVLIQSAPHLDALLELDPKQVKEGRIVGWNAGEGWINAFPDDHQGTGVNIGFIFNQNEETARDFVLEFVNTQSKSKKVVNPRLNQGCWEIQTSNLATVRFFAEYGLAPETRKRVTPEIAHAPIAFRVGYLQGLFSADGSVSTYRHSKSCRVILVTVNKSLAEGVQLLLADLGIKTSLRTRSEKGMRYVLVGRTVKTSGARTAYTLRITGAESTKRFARLIGFPMSTPKQEKLEALLVELEQAPKSYTHYWSKIVSIEPTDVENIYNLTTDVTHSLIANGVVVSNCGEQPLGAFSVCNLGAINLSRFYDAENDDVAWDDLAHTVQYATRFLDNVIDSTPYFFEENARVQGMERRVGLGTMGVAELMIKLKIRYGSPESEQFIDKLYKFIAVEAYKTSSAIAKEKGSFPAFDAEKFLESGFMLGMPEDVREQIRRDGIRNVTLLTQAPTGCVAPDTLVSTATGMQPMVALGDPQGMQWQIMTKEVHTDVGLRKTSHFYVNGHQPVKQITTQRGFSLTATHNHRIRVIDEQGDYVWRRMDELQQGDKVVLKKGTLDNSSTIELTPVAQGNRALTSLPKTLTPELAELLGLYMGNGYLKKRGGIHIVVSQKDSDLLDHVRDLMQKVWGERYIGVEERIGCWIVNLTGYYISRFFEINGLGKPKGNKGERAAGAFIPAKVLQAGRECVAAFLRGLFESDGSVHRGMITLVSTSAQLINQVQIAMLGLGIVTTTHVMPAQEGRYGERPLHELRVLNRREGEKFAQIIGFISQRKRAKVSQLGNIVDHGDSIAVPELCLEFYEKSAGMRDVQRQVIRSRAIRNGAVTQQFVRETTAQSPV
jgi:intein/homing endonuclease